MKELERYLCENPNSSPVKCIIKNTDQIVELPDFVKAHNKRVSQCSNPNWDCEYRRLDGVCVNPWAYVNPCVKEGLDNVDNYANDNKDDKF
jgi:hypothetical protein